MPARKRELSSDPAAKKAASKAKAVAAKKSLPCPGKAKAKAKATTPPSVPKAKTKAKAKSNDGSDSLPSQVSHRNPFDDSPPPGQRSLFDLQGIAIGKRSTPPSSETTSVPKARSNIQKYFPASVPPPKSTALMTPPPPPKAMIVSPPPPVQRAEHNEDCVFSW